MENKNFKSSLENSTESALKSMRWEGRSCVTRLRQIAKELQNTVEKYFTNEMNAREIYIEFLRNQFIPKNREELMRTPQFYTMLKYTSLMNEEEISLLYDITQNDEQTTHKKKKEVIFFPSTSESEKKIEETITSSLEKILENEQSQVEKKGHQYQQAWKDLSSLFDRMDFRSMGLQSVKLFQFGSSVNTFQTSASDFDLTLLTDSYVEARDFLQLIQDYFKVFKRKHLFNGKTNLINSARIPILVISFKDIKFDLTINNILGIVNTHLLKTYSMIDGRCHKLGMLAKMWATANKICDGKTYISSYGFLLLVINFLQTQEKPTLPCLQRMAGQSRLIELQKSTKSNQKMEINIAFESDLLKIRNCFTSENHHSLAETFAQFLHWLKEIMESKTKLISIKTGTLEEVKENVFFNSVCYIEDPFDKEHNLAEKLRRSLIHKEFNYEYQKFLASIRNTLDKLKAYRYNNPRYLDEFVKELFEKKVDCLS